MIKVSQFSQRTTQVFKILKRWEPTYAHQTSCRSVKVLKLYVLKWFDSLEFKISVNIVLSINELSSCLPLLHFSYSNWLESDSEVVLIAFMCCYVEPDIINYVEMTSSHVFRISCRRTIPAFTLLKFHPFLNIFLNLPVEGCLCSQERILRLKLIIMACLIFKEVNCEVKVCHVAC